MVSSCPRLRLFHCYASEEDMFTEEALIKMLVTLPTLKDLFIQQPPYHVCEFLEAILEQKVKLDRVLFGNVSWYTANDINMFRLSDARKKQLLPVPVVDYKQAGSLNL